MKTDKQTHKELIAWNLQLTGGLYKKASSWPSFNFIFFTVIMFFCSGITRTEVSPTIFAGETFKIFFALIYNLMEVVN